jgi:hypothetical protein
MRELILYRLRRGKQYISMFLRLGLTGLQTLILGLIYPSTANQLLLVKGSLRTQQDSKVGGKPLIALGLCQRMAGQVVTEVERPGQNNEGVVGVALLSILIMAALEEMDYLQQQRQAVVAAAGLFKREPARLEPVQQEARGGLILEALAALVQQQQPQR